MFNTPNNENAELNSQRNFSEISISIASPEDILSWTHGEVRSPETINYRSFKPETDGIFCEKIFGPQKDYECACGKYKGIRNKGITCDRCGVDITHAHVRRERMGHISLSVPISHIWFLKCIPSYMAKLLDLTAKNLEKVIYFEQWIVTDSGNTPLLEKQLLTDEELRVAKENYGDDFKYGIGAEVVEQMLKAIELQTSIEELKIELQTSNSNTANHKKLTKKMIILSNMLKKEYSPRMDDFTRIASFTTKLTSTSTIIRWSFCNIRFK